MLVCIAAPATHHLYVSFWYLCLHGCGCCPDAKAVGVVMFLFRLSFASKESSSVVNMCRVRPFPDCVMKSGPVWPPRMARYERTAFIGQMVQSVAPT